jgi:hypothetical protein
VNLDMKKKARWILLGICIFLFLIFIIGFLFRQTILFAAGRYMAPGCDCKADVAILEGTEFIRTGVVIKGLELMSSGRVKRLIIIIQNIAPAHRPFGINGDYPDIVRNKLKEAGLKEENYKVIVVPIRHPITLTEAKAVLGSLAQQQIRSAILLSSGFHTRRSFLLYKHTGIPLHIAIFPSACFTGYQLDNWWTQEMAVREFTLELLKLVYYLGAGYIPLT